MVTMGRYRQELRLEGTDLDNPSSGQTPTSCPRGLILGGWEEVQETQRGGQTGLAQLWVQRGWKWRTSPSTACIWCWALITRQALLGP